MSEPVRLTVTRTRGDFVGGLFANFFEGAVWVHVVTALALAAVLAFYNEGDALARARFGALCGGAFFLLMLAITSLTIFITAQRSWSLPGAREPIEYTFTATALEAQTRSGASRSDWSLWKRAFETSRFIIIRHRLNLAHILPKREIAPETLARLKALLRETLSGRVRFKSEPA